jgi:hypothetical protein
MDKKLTADEKAEVATFEANIAAEERSEREALDQRVKQVFTSSDMGIISAESLVGLSQQPVSPPRNIEIAETPEACFVREATAVMDVVRAGNAVSPGELQRLVNEAVGLLSK